MNTTHDPKLFEKIRLAIFDLAGYGLICQDKNRLCLTAKRSSRLSTRLSAKIGWSRTNAAQPQHGREE